MSKKHNTRHNRTPSNYPNKVREQGGGSRLMHDYIGVGKLQRSGAPAPDRQKGMKGKG